MPTYQYACTACQHQLEAVQSFTDDPLTQCPVCDGQLRKLFGSVGIVFKGPGFYRTDSRSAANGKSNGKSTGEGSSDGGNANSDGKDKPGANGKDGGGAKDGGAKDSGAKDGGTKGGGSSKEKAPASTAT